METEKVSGIYCIENLINNKRYIGLSVNIYKRWKDHKCELNRNKHINIHLQRAWNSFGEDNFRWYILEECDKYNLSEKEQYYIKMYNSSNEHFGYNMTSGGESGYFVKEETLKKRSISSSKHSIVQLNYNGEYIETYTTFMELYLDLFKNKNIKTVRKNITACCKGTKKSVYGFLWVYDECYDKNKQYFLTKNTTAKKVKQYDKIGNLLNIWNNAREIEKELNISYKQISQACYGNKKFVHNYVWRFINDDFNKYSTDLKNTHREVNQYDLNGNYINTYIHANYVLKILGINIYGCLNGKSKNAGGYVWTYK